MGSVPGPSRCKSKGIQEGLKEDRQMPDPPVKPVLCVSSHRVLGMLGNQAVRTEDQGEFHSTVAPAWEQVGNRVCSEVETAQCGGESGEVEAGFGETRKRRRGQMQMRAWSAFPGKWLCMLSHPWPEPVGSKVLDTVL